MIKSIRYSWGTIGADASDGPIQLKSVLWTAPDIPPSLLEAADKHNVLEIISGGNITVGELQPSVQIEHCKIDTDNRSHAFQIIKRDDADTQATDELQDLTRYCEILRSAAGDHANIRELSVNYGAFLQEARRNAIQLRDFHQTLLRLTPKVFVTPAILMINIAVFVIMVIQGVHPLEPATLDLIAWGANFGPDTMLGEWWRIFTCTFLHGGIIHLGFNMFVLWQVGGFVERLFGNAGFIVLYVISALAGSMASLMWDPVRDFPVTSVGASGAVFGIFGAMLGFLVRQRDRELIKALSRLRNVVVMFIGVNIVLGLAIPRIDHSAHAGGLVAGFICGLILCQRVAVASRKKRLVRNTVAAAVGVCLIAGSVVFLISHNRTVDLAVQRIQFRYSFAVFSLEPMYRKHIESPFTGEQWAVAVEENVLPVAHDIVSQLDELDDLPQNELDELRRIAQDKLALWKLQVFRFRHGNLDELHEIFERK
ncbi:MAG: rhomboid family intramembrane serine protease [Planctomycetes bacterium]|nr:rhomboid family intramembrane serine protease [Planctomycetota bacterium]